MVEVSPIRTEQDYEAALAEVERLMAAQPGTPEGDRLDVLATLVQAYEASITRSRLRIPFRCSSSSWSRGASTAPPCSR